MSGSLEPEVQEVMSCLMWVLGTEPRSSARTSVTLEPRLRAQDCFQVVQPRSFQ